MNPCTHVSLTFDTCAQIPLCVCALSSYIADISEEVMHLERCQFFDRLVNSKKVKHLVL